MPQSLPMSAAAAKVAVVWFEAWRRAYSRPTLPPRRLYNRARLAPAALLPCFRNWRRSRPPKLFLPTPKPRGTKRWLQQPAAQNRNKDGLLPSDNYYQHLSPEDRVAVAAGSRGHYCSVPDHHNCRKTENDSCPSGLYWDSFCRDSFCSPGGSRNAGTHPRTHPLQCRRRQWGRKEPLSTVTNRCRGHRSARQGTDTKLPRHGSRRLGTPESES